MIPTSLQLGLNTFGDITAAADGASLRRPACRATSSTKRASRRTRLDAFGVGEHHRPDFAISAPGGRPWRDCQPDPAHPPRLRRDRASTDDPVRVFQRFSTLDALSNGRAEVILGRGSFTESYPLFGYDLADYEELFEEKLRAVCGVAQRRAGDVAAARTRSALEAQRVYPPIEADAENMGWGRRQSANRSSGRRVTGCH